MVPSKKGKNNHIFYLNASEKLLYLIIIYTDSKKKRYRLSIIFLVKSDNFKFNITVLFCVLIRNGIHAICFFEKHVGIKFCRMIFFFEWGFFNRFLFTGNLHDALYQKAPKLLNLTGNEIFMKIWKNSFSVKLPRCLEIVLKINSW